VSLIVASVPYGIFTLATGLTSTAFLIGSSIMVGFAAALLWIAHGHMVTQLAEKHELGFYSGIFFGLFKLNGLVGNLLLGLLRIFEVEVWLQFLVLMIISSMGTLLLFRLKKPLPATIHQVNEELNAETSADMESSHGASPSNSNSNSSTSGTNNTNNKTCLVTVKLTLQMLLLNKRMLLLSGFFIFSGYAAAFFVGVLPPKMPAQWLPYLLATYGLAEFIGALSLGKGADKFGKKSMMAITMLLQISIIVASFVVFTPSTPLIVYFGLVFLCGMADSGNITQIYACTLFYSCVV